MRNRIAFLFFFTAAALVCFATRARAETVPPAGLLPGSQYQIIFATADTVNGASGSGAFYNSFAASEAAPLASLVPLGTTWSAVVSTTDGTIADVNAPSSGVAVYNTDGIEVAASSIYSGGLASPVLYDQNGNLNSTYAWTGSMPDGTPYTPYILGNPSFAIVGQTFNNNGAWMSQNTGNVGTPLSIYVLSSVITVPTPEPATFTLLGTAFLLAGAVRFLRWRRASAIAR